LQREAFSIGALNRYALLTTTRVVGTDQKGVLRGTGYRRGIRSIWVFFPSYFL
jgi:hypothetical protein